MENRMESNEHAISTSSLESFYSDAEMLPWKYEQTYHGVKIEVVEFDHVKTRQLPDNIVFPEKWRDALETRIIDRGGPIMLEYFVPELEKTVYSNLVLGNLARRKGEEECVTPFFGHAAKICGREGKTVFSADPNITPSSYVLQRINLFAGYIIPLSLKGKSFDEIHEAYYGGLHVDNLDGMRKTISIDDARRLYTARALLSIALKTDDEPIQNISLITAPVHAERVKHYIKRQIKFEKQFGKVPQKPVELTTMSFSEEINKMKFYQRLMKPTLREYKPIFPPSAFKLDILVNEDYRVGYTDSHYQNGVFDLAHMKQIKAAIKTVLQDEKNSDNFLKYKEILTTTSLPLINKLITDLKEGVDLDYDEITKLEMSVSTHNLGWINTNNSRIH